jgi:hypothetical protein
LEKTGAPNAVEKARQLKDILRFKSLVEYEDSQPTEAQASIIALQATRIFQWARQILSENG